MDIVDKCARPGAFLAVLKNARRQTAAYNPAFYTDGGGLGRRLTRRRGGLRNGGAGCAAGTVFAAR